MGYVDLVGDLADVLNETAKGFALDSIGDRVHNGAELTTVGVCNISEQLGTLSFPESAVGGFKYNRRISCCNVPGIGHSTRIMNDLEILLVKWNSPM